MSLNAESFVLQAPLPAWPHQHDIMEYIVSYKDIAKYSRLSNNAIILFTVVLL